MPAPPVKTWLSLVWPARLAWCLALFAIAPAVAAEQPVRVGVLANKGQERCLAEWSPTIEYLNQALDGPRFSLEPLDFEQIAQAVAQGRVEFVLANSSIYVELEAAYGVSRIATMKIPGVSGAYSLFGGVIFCRADRAGITGLHDLRGKTFAAVDPQSFGGWRMAWREMKAAGLDPARDLKELRFGGTHDAVVLAVLAGAVEAGTVRTDILERMASENVISLDEFRILNPQPRDQVPFLRSTPLYPEWPMARVRHTPAALAERVAMALLAMPAESPAASAAAYAGWTIAEDYRPVHQCLQDLKLGPYQNTATFSLSDVARRYWPQMLLSLLLFLTMAWFVFWIWRLNRRLEANHLKLAREMEERRRAETEREQLISELRVALDKVKTLRGLVPICSNCKSIRDDQGYWQQVEQYVASHSEAEFTHGICPECMQKLYPELKK